MVSSVQLVPGSGLKGQQMDVKSRAGSPSPMASLWGLLSLGRQSSSVGPWSCGRLGPAGSAAWPPQTVARLARARAPPSWIPLEPAFNVQMWIWILGHGKEADFQVRRVTLGKYESPLLAAAAAAWKPQAPEEGVSGRASDGGRAGRQSKQQVQRCTRYLTDVGGGVSVWQPRRRGAVVVRNVW